MYTTNKPHFQDLVNELSDVVVSFNRSPLDGTERDGLYWRHVVMNTFYEDFRTTGHQLVYQLNQNGTVRKWHVFPMWFKEAAQYASSQRRYR